MLTKFLIGVVAIFTVLPASAQTLVCAEDMSCVTFDELPKPVFSCTDLPLECTGTATLVGQSSPIVTAPSGGIRLLVGASTGSSFGNLFAGVRAGVEYPVNRHLELDAYDTYSPVEQHYPYGDGQANQAQVGGIVWLSRSIGANGYVEHSQYHVSISKHAEYAAGGIVIRHAYSGMPVRFTFNYLQQWNNGIDSSGTESSHLRAGQFNLDMRVGHTGPVSYRVAFDFKVGHVLTQSNPTCDGLFGGSITCPRGGASSGAFAGSVSVEWPRRRATEQLAF